jgi:transposase
MIYVGMDVSCKSFMVHAINEKKKVVYRGEIASSREGLRRLLKDLGEDLKLVVFEAGNQMKWIALALKKLGVRIHVVHPNEVKWISESNGKTDRVDARKLAELARGDLLPRAVHIVEGDVRTLRELCRARAQLQSKRIALINTIRGLVLQEGTRLPVKFFQSEAWDKKLKPLNVSATLRTVVESFMSTIEAMESSEEKLEAKMRAIEDPRLDLLKTIPAIGDLTSRVLLGAIDEAKRFDDQKKVANYGALTPTIYQSGGVKHLGRINRDGRQEVRKILLQCAHTIGRMKPSPASKPLKDFYQRIERRRGKKKAVVAMARKLLTTAYGVMKSGVAYDPDRLLPQAA